MFFSGLHWMAKGHPNVLIPIPVVVGLPSHSDAVHTRDSQKPTIPLFLAPQLPIFFLKRQEGHPYYHDSWVANHSFILIGCCRLQSIHWRLMSWKRGLRRDPGIFPWSRGNSRTSRSFAKRKLIWSKSWLLYCKIIKTIIHNFFHSFKLVVKQIHK